MPSVLLLSRYDRMGPSSRVRHLNFIPALEAAGFTVKVAPFLKDEYVARLYRGEPRDWRFLAQAYWGRLQQLLSAGSVDQRKKRCLGFLRRLKASSSEGGRSSSISTIRGTAIFDAFERHRAGFNGS
jgi:hypothetical protein